MSDLDVTFAALGDTTRLAMVGLLRVEALRSSDIAEQLALSRPNASRHLQVLRRAGLIEEVAARDDARTRTYRLRPERFEAVRSWLEEVEAFWGDQLASFKAHVEGRAGAGARRGRGSGSGR